MGNKGQLFIDLLPSDQDEADPDYTDANASTAAYRCRRQSAELQAELSQLAAIMRKNEILIISTSACDHI